MCNEKSRNVRATILLAPLSPPGMGLFAPPFFLLMANAGYLYRRAHFYLVLLMILRCFSIGSSLHE